MEEKPKLPKWVTVRMTEMFRRILIRSAMKYFFTVKKATAQQQYVWQRHLLWQFIVKVTETKSRSHWHKERPNACTEVTL